MDPQEDGTTHINVYSRGNTELGRWMSNFSREPIDTEDGPFMSIEGYWYWLGTNDDRLRNLVGYAAKQHGKSLPVVTQYTEDDFREKIRKAIRAKALRRPDMIQLLRSTTLPLTHYYVFGGKVVDAGYKWILDIWEDIRKEEQLTQVKYYTGVGSRQTPNDVLILMYRIGKAMAEKGWILRSGNAIGADQAFAKGANEINPMQVELYLPWDTYNRGAQVTGNGIRTMATKEAILIAPKYVPHWARLKDSHKLLHARNLHQVLGPELIDPDKFSKSLLCWTPKGEITGGTATAIRCAMANNILVINLFFPKNQDLVKERLGI